MRRLLLLMLMLMLALAGCGGGGGGGGGGGSPPPTLTAIAVSPANPGTPVGVPTQFTAQGTYSDGTSKDITATVTWTSGTPAVATIGGSTGLAVAVSAGTATMTATSGAVTGSSTLTVTSATLQSIAVTPANATLAVPQGQQYKATGTYSDGTSHDLTAVVSWSSSTPAVAGIDAHAGKATAVAAGTTTITAALGTVSGSTGLTVTPAPLTTLSITPANASIAVPQSIQLTATGTYADGTTRDLSSFVTWTSGTTAVADISSNGVATAHSAGTTLVTAALDGIHASTNLTVNPAVLQSIAVTPANPGIAVGHQQQFTATGSYSDGTFADITAQVTWTSGATAVATVDGTGLAAGVSAGSATITATLGAVSGRTTLTVNAVTLSSIAVTPDSPTITTGQSQQFVATGTFSDGSTQDLSATATWQSGDTAVATVDGSGLASGLSAGSAVITATSGAVSGHTTLTVAAPVVSAVSPASVTLGSAGTCSGGTLTTTLQVTAAANVTWTVAADSQTPVLGGGTITVSPTSGAGPGSVLVTITVPPQTPSSSFSSCNLTYNLSTFNNVWVTFSDGAVIGSTINWTFVGVT